MVQSIKLPELVTNVPVSGGPSMTMDAASIGTGMAFLNAELEKRDARVMEPLTSVTWNRDLPVKTGGGWVEFSTHYGVDYQTTGGENYGVVGGQTNDIPIVQANLSKQVWQVFTFSNILKVPFVDQKKLEGIGRSLNDILDKGLRLNWNKSLDNNAYVGMTAFGTTGLVNNANVTATTAAQAGSSSPTGQTTSTKWVDKTPQEILNDVNSLINNTWSASQYDVTGMANHILIDPSNYAYIVGQPVTTAGTQSILQFLLDNNIAKNQGVELTIVPSRWCTGAGTGATNRMVGYVNDEDRVNYDQTVPLSRIATQPDVREAAYLTNYSAQFSEVKFLYLTCASYVDGI